MSFYFIGWVRVDFIKVFGPKHLKNEEGDESTWKKQTCPHLAQRSISLAVLVSVVLPLVPGGYEQSLLWETKTGNVFLNCPARVRNRLSASPDPEEELKKCGSDAIREHRSQTANVRLSSEMIILRKSWFEESNIRRDLLSPAERIKGFICSVTRCISKYFKDCGKSRNQGWYWNNRADSCPHWSHSFSQ